MVLTKWFVDYMRVQNKMIPRMIFDISIFIVYVAAGESNECP